MAGLFGDRPVKAVEIVEPVHVAADPGHLGAEFRLDLVELGLTTTGNEHPRTLGVVRLCDCPADARVSAGHDRDLALQRAHDHSSLVFVYMVNKPFLDHVDKKTERTM